ncbi:MAG: acyl-CoA dehydrogenase family protein [Firmicutes bacterium]|nr:acyl-CoA dehydrogenase family protein [Bacillota bacterium]
MIREFARREVRPAVKEYEPGDRYPHPLVDRMKELGLFGLTIPEEYGGAGLDHVTYALVFEELSAAWMSIAGVLGTHSIMAYVIARYGTEEQKQRFLPRMAAGELRGGLALTEPEAGSDVASIRTRARREGDAYVLNGVKTFITNSRHGTGLLVLAKTDPGAPKPSRGMSAFVFEHSGEVPGFTVRRDIPKLGYKGLDTCEIAFEDVRVPAENLVGGVEGEGFKQVMSGLEVGRINVAARAVGVARAALDDALRYSQQRVAFGKPIGRHQAIQQLLADAYAQIEAARQLVLFAARKKDRGERADLEAGAAKLFASEMCGRVTLDMMRVLGGYGYTTDFDLERYYRDAPLMIIGEGTNEIQRMVIANRLLEKYAL